MPPLDAPQNVAEALARVRGRIAQAALRAHRSPEEVTLVAVTKTVGPDRIREAIEAGQRHFGENYVQEALEKRTALGASAREVTWHFIGRLQRNKAKFMSGRFALVHSLDSLELAEALARHGPPPPVLVEVNLAGETTKAGVAPEGLLGFVSEVRRRCALKVEGLMALPPRVQTPEMARPSMQALRRLREELEEALGSPLPILSMGTSEDFEVAVEEGATHVRVGTALFGARPGAGFRAGGGGLS